MALCAALVSTQCQNAEGVASEASKTLRARFGREASGLFQRVYNEELQLEPAELQRVAAWAAYSVSVVLSSPGLRDFQLENLAGWAARLVEQLDATGDTFLGRAVYRKDAGPRQPADWCVQLCVGCAADLVHLLAQFRHEQAGPLLEGLCARLERFAGQLLQSRTLGRALTVGRQTALLQLFAAKCLNVAQSLGADDAALLAGLAVGALFRFSPARSARASRLVFDQVVAQEAPARAPFLAGLVVSAEGLRMDQDPDAPGRTLDGFVAYAVARAARAAAGGEFAQFLALFAVGYLAPADERAVHAYLADYVGRTGDAALGAYLVRKCGFGADELGVAADGQALDAGEWNRLVRRAAEALQ